MSTNAIAPKEVLHIRHISESEDAQPQQLTIAALPVEPHAFSALESSHEALRVKH